MARALEDHWSGALAGLVVTRYGYAVPCERIEIVEAAHPVPDAAGLAAAQRMLGLVSGLTADDLVIVLISGGGSSLLALPAPGLALDDKQNVNRALLKSGATISEMNCVRRHLSAIKGGRLAAACHPARVVTLLMSDVPGDDPIDIASGPTVADPTTCADALDVVRRYGIELPPKVCRVLESGDGETVKPGDPSACERGSPDDRDAAALARSGRHGRQRGRRRHRQSSATRSRAKRVKSAPSWRASRATSRRTASRSPQPAC